MQGKHNSARVCLRQTEAVLCRSEAKPGVARKWLERIPWLIAPKQGTSLILVWRYCPINVLLRP